MLPFGNEQLINEVEQVLVFRAVHLIDNVDFEVFNVLHGMAPFTGGKHLFDSYFDRVSKLL